MSNLESKYLTYVVINGIKGNEIEAPDFDINWDSFFSLSKKNEIFSLVNNVVPKEFLPRDLAEKFNAYTKSEMVRIIAMNQELAQIESELNSRNISYMLLKGSVIRTLYPKQVMRQMSDVDILYDGSRRDDIFEIMNGLEYEEPFKSGNSDDYHKAPYYTFEFHNKLFKDVYGFCPNFDFVWDNAIKDEDYNSKYSMNKNDFYLHHITHMYKHFYLGGFGLRFLVDTYLILTQWDLDFSFINEKLVEYNLVDFEKRIRNLSLALFEDALSEEQQKDLETIIFDGVFGSKGSGNKMVIEEVYKRYAENNENASTLKYALSRVFISTDKLKLLYPEIGDKNYLIPFFYIKRFLQKGITGFLKILREMKTIKNMKDKEEQ